MLFESCCNPSLLIIDSNISNHIYILLSTVLSIHTIINNYVINSIDSNRNYAEFAEKCGMSVLIHFSAEKYPYLAIMTATPLQSMQASTKK